MLLQNCGVSSQVLKLLTKYKNIKNFKNKLLIIHKVYDSILTFAGKVD